MTRILYQFRANRGDFRASAPCVAVEAYLRLAGLDYETVSDQPMKRSGSSVLPALRVDGRTIADSENIIRYFESRSDHALDSMLDEGEQAEKIMLWRLMNGSIYLFMVAERWLDPEVYPKFVDSFRGMLLPRRWDSLWPVMRPLVTRRVRGKYLASIAHLDRADRLEFVAENFSVLGHFLGDKEYLFGSNPSSCDAFLFAYTYAFLAPDYASPTRTLIERNHPNLVSFYHRMRPRLIGEIP
jgi:glutathione S-transferase